LKMRYLQSPKSAARHFTHAGTEDATIVESVPKDAELNCEEGLCCGHAKRTV